MIKVPKVNTEITFSRQLTRVPSIYYTTHDQRFAYMPPSEIGKSPSAPRFGKSKGRQDLLVLKNLTLIDYYIDKGFIKNSRKKGSKD